MKRIDILKAREESQGFFVEIKGERKIVKLIEELPRGYFTVEDTITKKWFLNIPSKNFKATSGYCHY